MSKETLKVSSHNKKFNENFELLTKYLDQQISEMTERQSAISYILLNKSTTLTQGEIAVMIGASRESINRSIKSAHLTLIEEYTALFSKKITEFLK